MGRAGRLYASLLSTLIFSFFGWIFESILFRLAYGSWYDRGFLTLPFCPIYGFTLLSIYILFGTTSKGGILLSKIKKGSFRKILYFLLAVSTSLVSEYLVGNITEKYTGRVLWDYTMYPWALDRYICLEVGIAWGVLICFATYLFDYLTNRFYKIPKRWLIAINIASWGIISIDFVVNLVVV